MSRAELLPDELVWTAEGHLSEVAMTAIADGEEAILPREAFGHLGTCEVCVRGVEGAASLSAQVSHALSGAASSPERRAFPVLAVAAAIALGTLSALPSLGAGFRWLVQVYGIVLQMLPVLAHNVAARLPGAWSLVPMVSLVTATALLLAGLSIARLAPRMVER